MTTPLVGVLDYDAGNIASVLNMIHHVGGTARAISDPKELDSVDRVILPGVGHFDHAARSLRRSGFFTALTDHAAESVPILGICLGMQLLLEGSEEGDEPGLGLIAGECLRFRPEDSRVKVPHMGWNVVKASGAQSTAIARQSMESRYYFVHSYYARPRSVDNVAGWTEYAGPFASVLDNGMGIAGYQFHPEKSHRFGMSLMRDYCVGRA